MKKFYVIKPPIMPTTITMPTPIFILFIVLLVWVVLRDDLIPLIKLFFRKKMTTKINGVEMDFRVERKKKVELN